MGTIPTNTTWKQRITELNAKGLTNLEISKILDTTPKHIQRLSTAYKIKANKTRYIKVDFELRQFLLGSFLGDGCFTRSSSKSKNAALVVSHGEKQTEYNIWKLKFLQSKEIVASIRSYTAKDVRVKKGFYTTNVLKTESNTIFNSYCSQYTPKKTVNYEFIRDLDAFGLAVWYMDDGFVTKNSFQISSCSFSDEEIGVLQRILKENFDINTNKNAVNEIYIVAESRERFISLVSPYIIPSLKYKLVPYANRVHVKQGELLEHPNKDNQQPSLGSNTFEGSTTNNRVLSDKSEDSNVDTSTLQSFIDKQKPLDSEYNQIISDNFWSLT
jgi:LAGLIDADG DNA endonuclease family